MKLAYKSLRNRMAFAVLILIGISACTSDDKADAFDDLYLSIPDKHFETILIELDIDSDGMVNQKMLRADAKEVQHLNLNYSAHFGDITDLTGIEGFVNLTLLSAAGQDIEEVDLSLNTQLDTLYLSGNNLSNIDVSNNTKLIFLDIQSNALTSISGLSEASNLKKLNLSFNDMETFNVDNASIEVLLVSHNLLKSVNTASAQNLKNVYIISNKITSVDFSNNKHLETLVISGNKLQGINLSQQSKLTHLYCSSNLLTGLDVSSNDALIDLRVDRNPSLTCIKIDAIQDIPTVSLSDYQSLNSNCN